MRHRRSVILITLASVTWFIATLLSACSMSDASPEQPIAFSHRVHLENEIDCTYCHSYVDRQNAAGIPSVELCVLCHSAMETENSEIQKIFSYADVGAEIPWVRLYEVPQFTYFSHKWHIRSEISCAECHGDIGQSDQAVRHMVYDMDWCVSCHEERGASVDCMVCHK